MTATALVWLLLVMACGGMFGALAGMLLSSKR